VDWCGTFRKFEKLVHDQGAQYLGGMWHPDSQEKSRGWLTAIDASTGTIQWRYESRRPMHAAITATSTDLLFTGELDGDFLVLDARDGTVLFRHDTGGAMNGGVVTYAIGGKQYIAVTSGTATRFGRAPAASATVTIFAIVRPDVIRGSSNHPRRSFAPGRGRRARVGRANPRPLRAAGFVELAPRRPPPGAAAPGGRALRAASI
jgi:PQQ-like domain